MALIILAMTLSLSGCIDAPRPSRPAVSRPALATPPLISADPAALRQCVGRLDRIVARYTLLPDRDFGNGCSALGAVQLNDIGVRVANLGAMTCGLAESFTRWAQVDLQTAARDHLGSRVVRVETMGSYACRNVNGAATGKLSEHARANAVDIGAFVLADGRRITVKGDWDADNDAAAFLRTIRAAACQRFTTVLSPDYNALHHDHLHFDLGGRPFCR